MVIFAFIYLLCILLRVSTVSFGLPMEEELGFDALQMGLIATSYFIGLFLTLLPSYFLIKKWGSKQVMVLSLFMMSLGMTIYGIATCQVSIFIGRFLIGCSHGPILFIWMRKLINMHEESSYGTLTLSLGSLGAILAAEPTFELIAYYTWRSSCLIYAFFALILLALAFLNGKKEKEKAKESFTAYLTVLKEIFHSRSFWQVTLFPSAVYGGYLALQTYWITPYLMNHLQFSAKGASLMATILNFGSFAAMLFGGSLRKMQHKIAHPFLTQGGCLIALALLYFISTYEVKMGWWIWALYGFFAQFAFLVFAHFNKRGKGVKYHHTCLASMTVTFLFAAIFQLMIAFFVKTSALSYRGAFHTICILSIVMLVVAAYIALSTPRAKPIIKRGR